jgi:hypothetical protein
MNGQHSISNIFPHWQPPNIPLSLIKSLIMTKVAVLGAAGQIGQPLSLLLKLV